MSGLTQRELESYLWGAATLLRGLIDASDYKQYIFPLLFFKRLSDVWDGDYEQALDETGDEGYATDTANDRFVIPEGAHWNDVRAAPRDVGWALLSAFLAIEAANPERLQGVFGNANWTDKAQTPDSTLKNLVEHFSKYDLTLAAVPEDELGNGYEYLIKKFADDSGHTAQEFYTNRTLVHLMAQMLEPRPGESIYDPTCGTGGMLISCLAEVKRRGGDIRTTGLYGRLEDLKNRHQQGLLLSIDFLKELLALAKDVVKTERETPEEEEVDRGKAALTELFEQAQNGDTPVMVKRVVDDIDEIVRSVRFDGWQATHAGEREVKKALRQTLFRYKLHQDGELFENAYGYIREYY